MSQWGSKISYKIDSNFQINISLLFEQIELTVQAITSVPTDVKAIM